ncbi:hypothetical protein C8R43DRAFT_411549 [Mycena crocata]|nr:hypothetical protein C8R43DRAFT_411549 [Mycena crocata]
MYMEEEEEDFGIDDQLFTNAQGEPLKFHLHQNIRQLGARLKLQEDIEQYGGALSDTDKGSDVILVNPTHPPGLDCIRNAYKSHSDRELMKVHVESSSWVKNCIKNRKCVHIFEQKRMGGVPAGGERPRTEFTTADDQHLIYFLACRIPINDEGGRQGNRIYMELMNSAESGIRSESGEEEFAWVRRHTWQSWRERYKKCKNRFDPLIATLAAKLDVAPHQKYHLSRNAPHSGRAARDEEIYSAEEEEEEEHDGDVANRKRRSSGPGSDQRDAKRVKRGPSLSPHSVSRTSSKGKEKALPDADRVGPRSDDSLFGPEEWGTQQTLPPRQAWSPTRDADSPQATLVETAAPPSNPPLMVESAEEPADIYEPPPRRQQPPRGSRTSGARPFVARSAIAPVRRTADPVLKTVEAPYRSTRARSGSLEPEMTDVDALMRKNRKAKKKELETVRERAEDEHEGGHEPEQELRSREPEGTVETQEEEQNVEEFLMDNNDQSGISEEGNIVERVEEPEERNRMPPPHGIGRHRARRLSLETDDGQTDQVLRRRQVSFSPFAASVASTTTRDVLRNLGGPRLSRRPESVTSKAMPSRRFAQNSPPDVFSGSRHSSVQVPSIDLQNPLYYAQSLGRNSVSRKGSVSSTESFPPKGTRARALKHDLKTHEKHTPYRPPAGTRAAAHVVASI